MRTRHGNEASDPDTRGDGDAGSSSEFASSAVPMQAAGSMGEAKVACERLIAAAPRHAEGLQLLGRVHAQCGDLRGAVELLRRSIEVNPNASAAWLGLGRILHQLKLSDQAAAMFRRAIALQPDLAQTHLGLGEVQTATGDHAAALTCYRRALMLNAARADGKAVAASGPPAYRQYDQRKVVAAEISVPRRGAQQTQYAEDATTVLATGSDRRLSLHIEQAFEIASSLHNEGRFSEADGLYQFILAVTPVHHASLLRLGALRIRDGKMDEAARLYSRAVAARPGSADALGGLGFALAGLGRHDEALACYEKALTIGPQSASIMTAAGISFHQSGQTGEAVALFERAIAVEPDHADAHFNLANILQGGDRPRDAIPHYGKVLSLQPRNYEACNNLATVLQKLGRFDEAINLYRLALVINPQFADGYYNLGAALLALDRNEDAIVESEKALSVDPSKALAHNNIGVALQALGRIKEAEQAYQRALQITPREAATHLNLAYLRRFTAGDSRLAALEKLAEDMVTLDVGNQISLHFALGKAFSDLGQHESSFLYLRHGNALKRAQLAYNEDETLGQLERIRATFTRELMEQKSGEGDPSDMPVFVVGMPRSGTTLVEQILASHSRVHGAEEIQTFSQAMVRIQQRNDLAAEYPDFVSAMSADALRALGSDYVALTKSTAPPKERIVNKLPLNFKYVGLINLALPNARIIHVRRDPLDTCFSCFSLLFTGDQSFAYDLGELGRYYRGYASLMEHWHGTLPPGVMIEIQYEDLVTDLAGHARTIIDHCNLPWDDACLAFHETRRPVKTASSVQVREPLYRTSIGRWRHYEAFLRPLIEALNDDARSAVSAPASFSAQASRNTPVQ
jgi:tetratricopeptide (TPR) repeat protein